jgi:ATP/maltotriose-dependent transcriptional regulator MalT
MAQRETETISTFGDYLRFLRRRARLTQTELSIAVGYSPGQISMLENGQRAPNSTTVAARFVPALGIEHDDARRQHLLALATAPAQPHIAHEVVTETLLVTREEVGQLEQIPWVPEYAIVRQAVLAQLQQWLERDHHVSLCGMGGMGKSTLAAQLATQLREQAAIFWMTCVDAAPLAPEMLLRQLALFASTRIADPQRLVAVLCQPGTGTPAIAYPQQLAMIAAALNELKAPLLIFDDAQVLQHFPPIIQLLEQLITRVPDCRMLFVTREELSLPNITQLNVGGLQPAEVELLCARLAQTAGLDVALVHQQTSGSPMLVRLAIQYWEQYGDRDRAGLPFPVASYLIDSILNTLPNGARRLLDVLAIWRGPLDLTQPQVAERLTAQFPDYSHQAGLLSIQRSRLIEHVTAAAPHPLLREPLLIAINAQPAYSRQLHQIAADLALQLDDPIRAVHHLIQSDDLERAYALVCAQSSAPLAPGQGVAMAGAVDELISTIRGPQQASDQARAMLFRLLSMRGDLLAQTTRADDAQSSYYAALALTTVPLDQAHLAEKIALCAYRRGAFEEALALCDQAVDALGINVSKDAISLRMQLESTRIRILITLARVDEARQLCETALAKVAPIALIRPELVGTIRAYANLTLGYIARLQGDYPLARRHLHMCVQQSHAVRSTSVEADALQYLGATLRDMGDMAGAEEAGQQALALAHTAENEYLMSNILHHLSLTDYYHADLERALWRTQRVLQLKIPMGDIDGMVASRMVQAIVLVARGDIQAARETAHQAGRDCDLLENSWLRGVADFGHAIVLSVTDDLGGAERCLLRALATKLLKRDVPFYTGTQMYLALVYVAQGRLIEASSIITPSLPPGAGFSAELLRELVRGMWLLGHDRREEAHHCAVQLIEQARRTGFLIYAQEGARLAALTANPPPLADLPRLICCPH